MVLGVIDVVVVANISVLQKLTYAPDAHSERESTEGWSEIDGVLHVFLCKALFADSGSSKVLFNPKASPCGEESLLLR